MSWLGRAVRAIASKRRVLSSLRRMGRRILSEWEISRDQSGCEVNGLSSQIDLPTPPPDSGLK